jgi:hypothetical protein
MYGVNRVKPFVEWLKKHGQRGYIGEFGVPDNNPRWNILMDNMLAYLKENCVPASYWAAGPGWGDYFMSVEPINGVERPQWPTLKKYMDSSSCTEIGPKKTVVTAPTTPTTPVATTPATTGVVSEINNITNEDWLNGVYRKKPGFSIPATDANKVAFKAGASVRLADGQVRKVTSAQVGTRMAVYLEGAAVDGAVVGYPKTLVIVAN